MVGKRNAGKSTLINAIAGAAAGDRVGDTGDDAGLGGRAV